ncbi:MAG: Nif3-like dinuclear metal center hexameric protein [Candidatus Cellulosilyticum pullistercoris]|uniref:GTP cyclohydrolase 1 type 2 homolog n=1 Tax=Candidatus Cellulosilyticum pullistercoris TaxID=2838521 RepID=A0A9E2KCL9_9FIRM|nr:Nif3-like dinuclear metal center hexameric protein [Candidatus Cellulosilyticum pullistercoris]
MPRLKEIIKVLEGFAPPYLAESWDNVGLMVGSASCDVQKVLCALDLNHEVIDEAIDLGANCIVTHHPFLFKPIRSINLETIQGQMIEKLIKHQIAVYSMHTNYDITTGGLNDYLANQLGLKDIQILSKTYEEKLYKGVIYVPCSHLEQVRDVVIKNMTCDIGKYAGCTFSKQGEGTFIPLEGSKPYIGETGYVEKVNENELSFIGTYQEVEHIIKEAKKVHPYEEVAVDVYPLENMKKVYGIGRYGELEEALSLETFVEKVKKIFNLEHIRITDLKERTIKRVAICSGAGSEYISRAAQVADVYLTGDLKFHEGQMAKSLGLTIIDVGHYASEQIALVPIGDCIQKAFPVCEIYYSKINGETLFIK